MTSKMFREERHGSRSSGDRRNARYRRGDLEGAEGGRLQGRRQLRRQRRGGAEVQGRDRHHVYKWDVSSFDACAAGIKQVEADLGPVEVLVNNAGITRDATLHRMKPEQWTAVINTNLGSLFNMCRNVIEGMRERKFGRIVNISSINGQKGQLGQTNYSAAKAGEIGFTKALAQESARSGITVNAICAGLHQHRDGAGGAEGRAGEEHPAADSDRPPGRAGGDRALRGVPGLRRRRPDHRLDAHRPTAGSISPRSEASRVRPASSLPARARSQRTRTPARPCSRTSVQSPRLSAACQAPAGTIACGRSPAARSGPSRTSMCCGRR